MNAVEHASRCTRILSTGCVAQTSASSATRRRPGGSMERDVRAPRPSHALLSAFLPRLDFQNGQRNGWTMLPLYEKLG